MFYKPVLDLKEMVEELDKLEMLETWHWDMQVKHRRKLEATTKKRRELREKINAAKFSLADKVIKG